MIKHGNNLLLNISMCKAQSSGSSVLFHKRTFLICTNDPRSMSKYGLASKKVCAKALMSFPSMFSSTALFADKPSESLKSVLSLHDFPKARFFGAS